MLRILVLAAIAALAVGCAHLDYVGEAYAPTTQVDLYFSEADVPKPYKVMGQMLATGDQFISASTMHKRIMERAHKEGADAVIILKFERVPAMEETRYSETSAESKEEGKKESKTSGSVSNYTVDWTEIRALFIKYRE